MFDNKQIETFRQIKAPDELKSKVLGAKPVRRQVPVMRYAAMAACTVLLMTAVLLFFPMNSGISVTTGGTAITPDGVSVAVSGSDTAAYSLARMVPAGESLEIPLAFEADGICRVTVSAGDLTMDGESLEPGTEMEADGALNLSWHINSADRDRVYSLVLHHDGEQVVLVMKYDKGWIIRLNEN